MMRSIFALLTVVAGFSILGTTANATPVRAITDLESISFFERTGGTEPTEHTFLVDGPELTTLLADPLGAGNFDIDGASTEYYDVYYSDADGVFNLDGEYLSISGVFGQTLPAGGGLNLAEIVLNFAGTPGEFGNFVASVVALGDNGFASSAGNAIDGDLQTHTTLGNTVGADQRLRITLGFLSSSGPPPAEIPVPAALPIFLGGLGLLTGFMRKRKAA